MPSVFCSSCKRRAAAFCEEVRYEDRKKSDAWGMERIIAYRLLCSVCAANSRARARELHIESGGIMVRRHCDFCGRLLTEASVVVEIRPCQPATQRRRLGVARIFEQYRMCRSCGADMVSRFTDQTSGWRADDAPGAEWQRRAS